MAKRIQKKKYPCIVLKDLSILPGMVAHYDLVNPYSVKSVELAMTKDHKLFSVSTKPEAVKTDEEGVKRAGLTDIYAVGSVVEIKQVTKISDGVHRVLVEGLKRAQIIEITEEEINCAVVREIPAEDDYRINPNIAPFEEGDWGEEYDRKHNEALAKLAILRESVKTLAVFRNQTGKSAENDFNTCMSFSELLDRIAGKIPLSNEERQEMLETASSDVRYEKLAGILARDIDVFRIKGELALKLKEKVDSSQKQYVLREQMKLIKAELGDSDDDDADEYREKAAQLTASDDVKNRILKEIDRYSRLHDGSSESEVSRGYIETLLAMPWDKTSVDNRDLKRAKQILDADHYGLDKVKERVLEFLAVRNLTGKGDSPIICLVGPPGTGKTSIAMSIARALDKKYVRVCLGGVRDEAEIRGHRRTYVGAMPGRIAAGLKNAGVKNPLMLLDEVDKMSSDHRGDTGSALLEVLDPEQNVRFSDHYIELDTDLSEVLFIATANQASEIPRPLLDRMEIIEVSGYTGNEKLHIAKDHLFPKQLAKNGLKKGQVTINDKAFNEIISGYTREAGVRSLERQISAILRKAARQIYEGDKEKVRISGSNLTEYLGRRKYERDMADEKDGVGLVRGLAVTGAGGDTLAIEAVSMPGKGEILLTGQLGDVMKESARAAISYVRSIASGSRVDDKYFENHDFHIHVPEGSVPKDGPSAGISMASAVYSAVTGRKIRCDVAMTGEITLRGRVLAIGGLKEKTLAAKNAGIKKVIVPAKNRKDIEELDREITEGLTIVYADSMEDVLREALA